MYAKTKQKGKVEFALQADGKVAKAEVAGDFNGWKPQPMRKQKDGTFRLAVACPPGRHEYKFVVDGVWVHDPDVPEATHNQFGSLNSVATI